MSRPRKPYGPNPPGRLFGTMIKVLAAEMSDQRRLARGKRYWADDAVIDIVVGHGAVTTEVQGSRQKPYVVTIEAGPGSGVPGKREIWAQCTCPDDAGTGTDLCKHAVASFFALADEIAIEPELVDRWRAGRRFGEGRAANVSELPTVHDDLDRDDGLDDDDGGAHVIELRPRVDAEADAISRLLSWPSGVGNVDLPSVTELDHSRLQPPLVAEVLDDALDHLAIRWE